MFNKKNDPLVASVAKVMAENAMIRRVTESLNEELGIASKKALPFEHHANYDALLEQRIAEAKSEGSTPRNAREAELAKKHGDPNKITHGDVLKARGVVEEKSKTQDKLAKKDLGVSAKDHKSEYSKMREKLVGKGTDRETTRKLVGEEQSAIQQKSGNPIPPTTGQRIQGDGEKAPQFTKNAAPTSNISPSDKEGLNKKINDLKEASYSAKAARAGKDIGKPGKMFKKIASDAAERYGSEERGKKVAGAVLAKIRAKHMEENVEQLDEKAPPGDKFERMVKHIKAGYKEGGLTKKEKSIAYATAWKAKNKEQMKEDFDSVMEEIRANLGEDAFDSVMEDIMTNIPTPDSQRNVRPPLPSLRGAAKAKEAGDDNTKTPTVPTPMPAAAKERQQSFDAKVQANMPKTDMTVDKKAQAYKGATEKTIGQEVSKNLPEPATRSGQDITNQVADASRFKAQNPTVGRGTKAPDTGSPSNLGAAKGPTGTPDKAPAPAAAAPKPAAPAAPKPAAPTPPPRPSELQPNRSVQNGDAAQRIQQSYIERNK